MAGEAMKLSRGTMISVVVLGLALLAFSPVSWRIIRKSDLYWSLSSSVGTKMLRSTDPETAHETSIKLLSNNMAPLAKEPSEKSASLLKTKVFGLDFANPIGLAAGYDKQAHAPAQLLAMGFGFIELGGVTPLPQPGNEKPRVFRLLEDQAIINRFGLNSDGADVVAGRLAAFRADASQPGIVGVNIAKNTTSTDAVADYVQGVEKLGSLVDFIVLNVSCPNVAWTSQMQKNGDEMANLVCAVKAARDKLSLPRLPALLMKVGPDMDEGAKKHMAEIALKCGVDGLVVSNTTTTRPESLQSSHKSEKGGLSGPVLKEAALATLKDMYRFTQKKIPLIGVGGISSGEEAYERIRAGASLVQIYTALVYNGPALIPAIKEDLERQLTHDGFTSVSDAVGVDADAANTAQM